MDNPNRNQELSWLDKDVKRFRDIGYLIPKEQVKLYNSIRDHWVNGRVCIDIGSSIGLGTNILSHMARHVWGIDINEEAIRFANNMFARPNLSFDLIDIENPNSQELAQFEVVVMSEVIEHLSDPVKGIEFMKRFFSDKMNTVGFVTAPNINHPMVQAADLKNPLHMNRWTPGEFYALLTKHFRHVTLYNNDKLNQWTHDETMDGEGICRITVAKVEGAIQ